MVWGGPSNTHTYLGGRRFSSMTWKLHVLTDYEQYRRVAETSSGWRGAIGDVFARREGARDGVHVMRAKLYSFDCLEGVFSEVASSVERSSAPEFTREASRGIMDP